MKKWRGGSGLASETRTHLARVYTGSFQSLLCSIYGFTADLLYMKYFVVQSCLDHNIRTLYFQTLSVLGAYHFICSWFKSQLGFNRVFRLLDGGARVEQ